MFLLIWTVEAVLKISPERKKVGSKNVNGHPIVL